MRINMAVYLDNAATTQIRPEVVKTMLDSLAFFGNSEAKYYEVAEKSKELIKNARSVISKCVGCDSDEVIFTSGATESNNIILKGTAFSSRSKKTIIISDIEHSSVDAVANYLQSLGYKIIRIPVDQTGRINLKSLEESINTDTLLVSIIWVNNEIGTIQDMEAIDNICFSHGVDLHSDATQAIGKIEIDLRKFKSLKYLTFTAHKIYGPKGIGAAIIRKTKGCRTDLTSIIHGGEQENGYRAGTLSNELIAGFAKACELITSEMSEAHKKLLELENVLVEKLKLKFNERIIINNDFKNRVPGIVNCRFIGYDNMILLKAMSPLVAASTGSACGISKPSRVLKAIGLSDKEISESIRFSLSQFQTIQDLSVIDEL